MPGKGKGGYQVPADGDTAHQFQKPGPNDIRGPCPGLNAAANHNFLARDVGPVPDSTYLVLVFVADSLRLLTVVVRCRVS